MLVSWIYLWPLPLLIIITDIPFSSLLHLTTIEIWKNVVSGWHHKTTSHSALTNCKLLMIFIIPRKVGFLLGVLENLHGFAYQKYCSYINYYNIIGSLLCSTHFFIAFLYTLWQTGNHYGYSTYESMGLNLILLHCHDPSKLQFSLPSQLQLFRWLQQLALK